MYLRLERYIQFNVINLDQYNKAKGLEICALEVMLIIKQLYYNLYL